MPSMLESMNVWAVLAAGVLSMALGAVWYSPALFARAWMRESGMTEEKARAVSPVKTLGTAFVLALIGAAVFAAFLGPAPKPAFATAAGFAAGLCWVAGSFGINYLFEQRSLKLFLINGGYHTLQYTLIGLVLGLWH
jgi:hypothetical protein